MADQIFVLGFDGNLWLEQGPFGQKIPPPRVPVDGNVDLFASFEAVYSNEVFVCGSDGNLWLEEGPFVPVPLPGSPSYPPAPSTRYQIDGSVGAFDVWDPSNVFVCGNDGNLWLEFGFGTTIPSVPPLRYQIDGNVHTFQVMGLGEVFVLGTDGNLWHEFGPFGAVPPPPCNGGTFSCRNQVDGNVDTFFAVDSNNVYVLGTDGNLWLEQGPFGNQVPPPRVLVDSNVLLVWGITVGEAYVLGSDLNLWLEHAPFGTVPLPPCSQTSGFGQEFACRDFIWSNVAAFGWFPDAGGLYVNDGNGFNLWQVGYPPFQPGNTPVQIDGNVVDFQPLSFDQMMRPKAIGARKAGIVRPPVRVQRGGRRLLHRRRVA